MTLFRRRRSAFLSIGLCAPALAATLTGTVAARADPILASQSAAAGPGGPLPTPLDALGPDLQDAFTGTPLLLYGAAFAATGALAFSGADHTLRVQVQTHMASRSYGDAAYYGGYLLPAIVAPAIYLAGVAVVDRELAGAGSAAVQALVVTVMTTGLLKLATGRPFPRHGGDPAAADRLDHPEYAREFAPFSLQWAWPSGHTSATVAIAAALTAYTEKPLVLAMSYSPALLIGFGMIVGDHHWTSDVVAGALVGQGIGYSIGSSFRSRATVAPPPKLALVPLMGSVRGIAVAGCF